MAIPSINTSSFDPFGIGPGGVSDAASAAASTAASAGDRGAFDGLIRSLENAKSTMASNEPAAGNASIDKTDKLYEQCEALEAFLIKNLLNSMRNTIQKSGFIDQGFAGDMYEDMLYDEYATEFTKNTHFGFAEIAYLELTGQRGTVINEKF
ncbi:MAG: rod-binding protein [Treponema sp.]|jgi:flagellar protein FlgJ|nr:rod-binding protein [Treponema sp.]